MVQTYTKHVWACSIPNTRFSSILAGIQKMLKVTLPGKKNANFFKF
jgi:hypothetical protein